MDSLLLFVLGLFVLKWAAEWGLAALNARHLRSIGSEPPPVVAAVMDGETFRKSVDYTLTRNRFGRWQELFETALTIAILAGGILPMLWLPWTDWLGLGAWSQALGLVVIAVVLSLPSLPFEAYSQFVIEERFGFNKSSVPLWISDKVKGWVLSVVIGVPLLALILWVANSLPLWWIWAALIFLVFQVAMTVLYPMFIMPLFNKFEPLPEGELRSRLMDLADRTGFAAQTILVMDGSKRSAHSNAFFSGLGKFRRIVLFDTLIEQLDEKQLEAVLAHEIGHYKLGHIPRMLIVSAIGTLLAFGAIGFLAESPRFFEIFGFPPDAGIGAAFLLFSLLAGVVTFWFSPLFNLMSRKHEYEADAFARKAVDGPDPLVQALHSLHEKNLSNPHPHPWFSFFYYSHPTLPEREAALRAG